MTTRWAPWLPVLHTRYVPPVLGERAVIWGRQCVRDDLVVLQTRIIFGSTTTYGHGGYGILLPYPQSAIGHSDGIGHGYLLDFSADARVAVTVADDGWLYADRPVTAVHPFTLSVSDRLVLLIAYTRGRR
jgi:hypothetical protein